MEQWKAIPGFEGGYEVSDQGRVRSLDRTIWRPGSQGGPVNLTGQPIKPYQHSKKTGHLAIELDRKRRFVHHLVLEAFVGPRPEGLIACHNNDDPTDNRLVNLKWGTWSENETDAQRNARRNQKKTRCTNGHELSGDNLALRKEGNRQRRCCRQCERDRSNAYNARKRKAQE